MIQHYARPDIELYQLATELFNQQCTVYGAALQHDLEVFCRRREVYERAWQLTSRLRATPIYRMLRRK
jgi:hypothetical protein